MAATETRAVYEERTCQHCGAPFTLALRKLRYDQIGAYCSSKCTTEASKAKRPRGICQQCGKTFAVPPAAFARGQRFCSSECAYAAKRMELTCQLCGQGFTVPRGRLNGHRYKGLYYSRACASLAQSHGSEERQCIRCGTSFTIRTKDLRAAERQGLFCSRECHNASRREAKPVLQCNECGREFRATPTFVRRGARFCSRACWDASAEAQAIRTRPWSDTERIRYMAAFHNREMPLRFARVFLNCEQCGTRFEVDRRQAPQVRAKRRFCSTACHHLWGRQHPEESYLYIDGRGNDEYEPGFTTALKERIRQRDKNHCVLCERSIGKKWAVHHLDGAKIDHSPGNLALLCPGCHGRVHRARHRAVLAVTLRIKVAQKVAGYLPAPASATL
jgi:hypothetical protein